MTIKPVVRVSERKLIVKDRTILAGVPDNLITTSGSTSGPVEGVFIGAAFDEENSRHVLPIGALRDVRFMACFRFKLWWMAQKMGDRGSEIPLETQFLLVETKDGSHLESDDGNEDNQIVYTVFLPLIEGSFRACLQGNANDELELCLESGDSDTKAASFTHSVFVHAGTDPFVTITEAIRAVKLHLKTFRQRHEKKTPGIVDYFGWCTWDAFYQEVTQEGVEAGLESLAKGGTPPKFVIIDDGWQSVGGDDQISNDEPEKKQQPLMRLTGIKENEKFQNKEDPKTGIRNIVDIAKNKHGLKYVYVWHAITGYWGGVRPGVKEMEEYESLMKYPNLIGPSTHNIPFFHHFLDKNLFRKCKYVSHYNPPTSLSWPNSSIFSLVLFFLPESKKNPIFNFILFFKKKKSIMKRDHQESCGGSGSGGKGDFSPSMRNANKAKMWEAEQDAGGMDELLEVLGYKVRSSEMADVAQKLEQLEMVMGTAQEDGISHLATDSVHYNPSDLSGWVQSMLSELNNTGFDSQFRPIQDPAAESSTVNSILEQQHQRIFNDDSEYDLRAIPGSAAYPQPDSERENNDSNKRMRISIDSSSSSTQSQAIGLPNTTELSRPVIVVDSQETGVQLVHTLMASAEAIQQENLKVADALVKHIGLLAASQAGAMRKVATYFAEALARRIYRIYPQDCLDPSYNDILQMHFYETCPYLKFAHFTANQAILETFKTSNRVHVIDFSLKQGMQWPALMQALALRPGGPPAFRLTGIGPPQPDGTDALQQVGWKLAQLADNIGVEFEFRGFVCNSLADLEPDMLDIRPPEVETVAVNSVFELHRLLAHPGGIEKVVSSIKAMNPKIITIVEQEANHNSPVFLDRFTEALHYYSSLFDSLEGSGLTPPSQDQVMSEVYLGKQICNIVACEGTERIERHESLTQWRSRLGSAGFDPVHLGSNAYKQASMLLDLFAGGDGYRVEENNGCLMLGWHTRPLIATSAWQLATESIR